MWLPRDSAFHVAQETKGDQSKAARLYGWSQDHELMLGLINLVRHQTYVLAQTNSKKKIPPPKPVTGPRGEQEQHSKSSDVHSIARSLLAAQS